jgi:hypothetical protein
VKGLPQLSFLAALLMLSVSTSGVPIQPAVAIPTVTGPIQGGDHGLPFGAPSHVPAGYVHEEYFLTGTASAYERVGNWDARGAWVAKPSAADSYRVRMLILRPAEPRRFNGVVVVEWLNVSAQFEGAADFAQMNDELIREGYVWVGIGAQATGVNAAGTGLKAWDAARYGSLAHPGDAYSYDIFSQGAQALRRPATVDPLGGLRVQTMLATGRSQSAQRLLTYLNAIHPFAHVYDGFLAHSRGAYSAALADGFLLDGKIPSTARVRTDPDVPVLELQTEYDVIAGRGYLTRQEPTAHYRRWEIAGASHAEAPRWVVDVPPPFDLGPGCQEPVNAAPHHAVVKAALHALARWSRDGVAPPQSPDIQVIDASLTGKVAVRDRYGNAMGGVRLPELEAPTAVLDGRPNTVARTSLEGVNFCATYGHTIPFDRPTLASLYPTHDAFVQAFNRAVDGIVRQGFWLEPEADEARHAAERSQIGR